MRKYPNLILTLMVIACLIPGGCKKTDGKVANPTAVEVYKVSITQFPASPPGGGTWDTEIAFSDPFGRPDLKVIMNDDLAQFIGPPYGNLRLNANHSNLPINFDIDTLNTVALDRTITLTVSDEDEFDPDDYMGTLTTDSLKNFKEEQPGYISVSSGDVAAKVYIHWK